MFVQATCLFSCPTKTRWVGAEVARTARWGCSPATTWSGYETPGHRSTSPLTTAFTPPPPPPHPPPPHPLGQRQESAGLHTHVMDSWGGVLCPFSLQECCQVPRVFAVFFCSFFLYSRPISFFLLVFFLISFFFCYLILTKMTGHKDNICMLIRRSAGSLKVFLRVIFVCLVGLLAPKYVMEYM